MSKMFQESIIVLQPSTSPIAPVNIIILDISNNEIKMGVQIVPASVGTPIPPQTIPNIRLEGKHGNLWLGGNNDTDGDIYLFAADGNINESETATIHLGGDSAFIRLGGSGQNGDLFVRNANGQSTIKLDGRYGNIVLGGDSQDGDVILNNESGQETIRLSGGSAEGIFGGNSQPGELYMRTAEGKNTIRFNGELAEGVFGGNGKPGNLWMRTAEGKNTIWLDGKHGNIRLGGNGQDGDISLRNKNGANTIRLDGDSGDIQLLNADCAEEFELAAGATAEPGTVVEIRPGRQVAPSQSAYNQRVVGVVSGAGDFKPGIVLDRQRDNGHARVPVALMGKVFCQVDARHAPIVAGDLLTTSSTPGHAMKVAEPAQALGAIVGKALDDLSKGQGLISVLVALQ